MIAADAKSRIEVAAAALSKSSPFFLKAREGQLSRLHIANYIYNIRFILSMTPVCLRRAAQRASELGNNELAEYYQAKLVEEDGHEEWAKSDLANLGFEDVSFDPSRVSEPAVSLMKYVAAVIDRDPRLYLIYIYFAEYITVRAGPELLEALDRACGIERAKLTAVANHEELDRDHVIEGASVITKFLGEADLEACRSVIARSQCHLESMFEDVATRSQPLWS